jgi:hypothetical protein
VIFHNNEVPTLNYRYSASNLTPRISRMSHAVSLQENTLPQNIHRNKKLIRPQEEVSTTSNININTKIYKTKTSHVCFV